MYSTTKEELKLFSEFLSYQKEFEDRSQEFKDLEEDFAGASREEMVRDQDYYPWFDKAIPAIKTNRDVLSSVDPEAKEYFDDIYAGAEQGPAAAIKGLERNKNITDGQKAVIGQQINAASLSLHSPSYTKVPKILKDGKHRMSFKYAKDLDKEGRDLNNELLKDKNSFIERAKKGEEFNLENEVIDLIDSKYSHYSPKIMNISDKMRNAEGLIDKESDLAKSKYDDKYSSKRIEKWLDKKIDADKAKNIVDRRHKKDTDYLAKDVEKGHNRDNFHISDIGRKWNDTGIVYNEALGRNLNKDAAIAAGVTAGLVGGGVALRKHLKRKRLEKEIAENKFKTSDKKKKK
jgi:hypothetical protein